MISAVVLAVGRNHQTNAPDAPSSPGGKVVLQRVLESAVASRLDEVVCVTDDLSAVRRQIPIADRRLLWLPDRASEQAETAARITGLWATDPRSEGVMFLGDDQPIIHEELINALIARFNDTSALIVASSLGGEPRSPLLISRKLFPELLRLSSDNDERVLLSKYKNQTELVESNEKLSLSRAQEPKHVRTRGRLN